MRLVWHTPSAEPKAPQYLSQTQKSETSFDVTKNQKNLAAFYEAYLESQKLDGKLNDALSREDFRKLMATWNSHNNFAEMRTAGLKAEEDKFETHMVRPLRLAREFLEKTNDPNIFAINFRGNETAEWKIGFGDMVAIGVQKIRIRQKNHSSWREAIRLTNFQPGQRTGFYYADGAKEYAAVHTGDTVEILESIDPTNKEAQTLWQKEHDHLYHKGGKEAIADGEVSPDEGRLLKRNGIKRQTALAQAPLARSAFIGMQGLPPAPSDQHRVPSKPSDSDHHSQSASSGRVLERLEREISRSDYLAQIAEASSGTNKFQQAFDNNKSLQKGRLGCAYVAANLLIESGYLNGKNENYLNVKSVENELKGRGWHLDAGRKPEKGCVIIWEKSPDKISQDDEGRSDIKYGHEHIGIAINESQSVDNHFQRPDGTPGPLIDEIYGRKFSDGTTRGVRAIYFPPEEKTSKTRYFSKQTTSSVGARPPMNLNGISVSSGSAPRHTADLIPESFDLDRYWESYKSSIRTKDEALKFISEFEGKLPPMPEGTGTGASELSPEVGKRVGIVARGFLRERMGAISEPFKLMIDGEPSEQTFIARTTLHFHGYEDGEPSPHGLHKGVTIFFYNGTKTPTILDVAVGRPSRENGQVSSSAEGQSLEDLDKASKFAVLTKPEQYDSIIAAASQKFGVDEAMIRGVIGTESSWDSRLASGAGAGGTMQLMPFILDAEGKNFDTYPLIRIGKAYYLDPRDERRDVEKNIFAGTKLLRGLLRQQGDQERALQAYNWGSGNLKQYDEGLKNMPRETRQYAGKVLANAAKYQRDKQRRDQASSSNPDQRIV